jgi:hypothetical protein
MAYAAAATRAGTVCKPRSANLHATASAMAACDKSVAKKSEADKVGRLQRVCGRQDRCGGWNVAEMA